MKTQIYSTIAFGSPRYCRALNAQHARRIFARSINADLPAGARDIRVSLDQVRFVGRIVPAQLGATGYDQAVRAQPNKFFDWEQFQSYNDPKAFQSDKERNNPEQVIAGLFADLF